MRVLVIDGQGGGLGRQLVAAVKKAVPQAVVTAIGTNSAATSAMLKAGADRAATGENAVVVGCRRADVILGPIGIVMADYALLYAGSRAVFATHGHHYNTACPPPLAKGDILLHGHTHVPAWQEFGSGNLYLNPGSVAIPKENSAHSYMMLTDSGFAWKDLEGSIYHTLALDCPNCG